MDSLIRNSLLADRLTLRNDVSDIFLKNMKLRLEYGISKFGLFDNNIEPVYCSSINKHTCVEILNDDPSTFYLMLDEHHLEVLGAMDRLFYMYGQNDIKSPVLNFVMKEVLRTPEKRLFQTAILLLAERSLLDGNATRALAYLDKIKDYMITDTDWDGNVGLFDLDWFILKERRAEISHGLIMNYYVFHELAHIKAQYESSVFSEYKINVCDIIDLMWSRPQFKSWFDKTKIPVEDVACDVYALDLLFDFMYEEGGDYQFGYMVDSYISAITNLTIMDSVISHKEIEDWYTGCWMRIIMTLNTLALCKSEQQGHLTFFESIQHCLNYGYIGYTNYRKEIFRAMSELSKTFESIQEKFLLFSKEWTEEKKTALTILATLK